AHARAHRAGRREDDLPVGRAGPAAGARVGETGEDRRADLRLPPRLARFVVSDRANSAAGVRVPPSTLLSHPRWRRRRGASSRRIAPPPPTAGTGRGPRPPSWPGPRAARPAGAGRRGDA